MVSGFLYDVTLSLMTKLFTQCFFMKSLVSWLNYSRNTFLWNHCVQLCYCFPKTGEILKYLEEIARMKYQVKIKAKTNYTSLLLQGMRIFLFCVLKFKNNLHRRVEYTTFLCIVIPTFLIKVKSKLHEI